MNKKPKLAIFIDEANIYHSQKTLGWKIDYLKLKNYFKKYGKIKLLNFYTSYQTDNIKQEKFLNKLSKYGYKITKKKLKFIKNNNVYIKKGNLDIELSLDAYKSRGLFDTFILFSGDSDFEIILKELKNDNKEIITCSTRGHISKENLEISDKYLNLKKLKDFISL